MRDAIEERRELRKYDHLDLRSLYSLAEGSAAQKARDRFLEMTEHKLNAIVELAQGPRGAVQFLETDKYGWTRVIASCYDGMIGRSQGFKCTPAEVEKLKEKLCHVK